MPPDSSLVRRWTRDVKLLMDFLAVIALTTGFLTLHYLDLFFYYLVKSFVKSAVWTCSIRCSTPSVNSWNCSVKLSLQVYISSFNSFVVTLKFSITPLSYSAIAVVIDRSRYSIGSTFRESTVNSFCVAFAALFYFCSNSTCPGHVTVSSSNEKYAASFVSCSTIGLNILQSDSY